MLQKIRRNTKLQFSAIAVSVAVISGILGLSAYLTDTTDPLSASFKMRYGRNFGIDISSDNFTKGSDIIPGETLAFDPHLTNNGNYDVYVFMEVDLPDQAFSLNDISSDWKRLTSVTDKTVYYYGNSSGMTAVSAMTKDSSGKITGTNTSPLCAGISLEEDTDLKQDDYSVQAVGYAIQADSVEDTIDSTSPEQVWNMIGDQN